MAIHYRTQGIILKKINRGEADQLFTVYSKDFGKLEILGKAIRKIKSKLRAGAELFYFSEMEFIQGKTYKTLTDAILIDKFSNLRNDLGKLAIAYKISEIFNTLIKGQEKDENLWSLLLEIFDRLNKLEIRNLKLEIFYYYFFWNLLSILGYQPELYNCAVCQKRLTAERLFFNLKEGGVICNHCKKNVKSIIEISPEVVKILRILIQKDWQTCKRLRIEKSSLDELKKVSIL